MHSLCEPRKEKASIRDALERASTYPLKSVEVLDIVGTDSLDSHQFPVHQPLAGLGHPSRRTGSTIGFSEAVRGDPIALREKATPGGDSLKSV